MLHRHLVVIPGSRMRFAVAGRMRFDGYRTVAMQVSLRSSGMRSAEQDILAEGIVRYRIRYLQGHQQRSRIYGTNHSRCPPYASYPLCVC